MSVVMNVTAKARRETCISMTGDTRGCNVDPLEVDLEVRGQSRDFAADSSGVGDGDSVLSDPSPRFDHPTALHGEPSRLSLAVIGACGEQQSHASHRVHTRQKQA